VHTARRAAPSIGERFDDRVTLLGDPPPQVGRRRLGERGLGVAPDGCAAGGKPRCELLEEHLAARLGDVEQGDDLAIERRGPGRAVPFDRTALTGRIEQADGHGITSWVVSWLPRSPDTQPSMMAENMPALPPA